MLAGRIKLPPVYSQPARLTPPPPLPRPLPPQARVVLPAPLWRRERRLLRRCRPAIGARSWPPASVCSGGSPIPCRVTRSALNARNKATPLLSKCNAARTAALLRQATQRVAVFIPHCSHLEPTFLCKTWRMAFLKIPYFDVRIHAKFCVHIVPSKQAMACPPGARGEGKGGEESTFFP